MREMAWQIMTDVQYHAPRSLNAGEKAVLTAIAEAVRQVDLSTRRVQVSHDEVAWKASMKVNGARDAVERLAAKGALIRVPIGKDRHGQPVYTHRGQVPIYVVPTFTGDPDECPCYEHHIARTQGAVRAAPSDTEGTEGAVRAAPSGAEGAVNSPEGAVNSPEGAVRAAPHRVPGISGGDARASEPATAVVAGPGDDPPNPVFDAENAVGEMAPPVRPYPAQCKRHQDAKNDDVSCWACKVAREEDELRTGRTGKLNGSSGVAPRDVYTVPDDELTEEDVAEILGCIPAHDRDLPQVPAVADSRAALDKWRAEAFPEFHRKRLERAIKVRAERLARRRSP